MADAPLAYDHAKYINTLNSAAYLVELGCNCLRIIVGGAVPQIGDDIYNTGSYSQICNQHGGKSIKRVFRIFPVIPTVNPLMLDERTE